jgi:2-dehydropantoate 2-reductase
MRILIYGAGAVGCYIGAHLAMSGHSVVLLGRNRLVQQVESNGLTLITPAEKKVIRGIVACETVNEAVTAAAGSFDYIAFTMKAYDTVSAIDELRNTIPEIPPIVSFQNGVGNEESIQAAIAPERVIAGTLTSAVSMDEPGVIVEERARGLAVAADSPSAELVASSFRNISLKFSVLKDTRSLKWSKLLLNMLGNAVPAILGMDPADVFHDPRLFEIEYLAQREALHVMSLLHIKAENLPGAPVQLLAAALSTFPQRVLRSVLTRQVASGRGGKMPSLLLALRSHATRTEIAWLNGAVAQAADGLKRLAPINHALALLVTDIASGRTPYSVYLHNPQNFLAAIGTSKGMDAWRYGE